MTVDDDVRELLARRFVESEEQEAVAVVAVELVTLLFPMGTAEVADFIGIPKPNVRKMLEGRGVLPVELRLGPVWRRCQVERVKVDYDAERERRSAEERSRPDPAPRNRELARSGKTQHIILQGLLGGTKSSAGFELGPEQARSALVRLEVRGLVELADSRRGQRLYKLTTAGRAAAKAIEA